MPSVATVVVVLCLLCAGAHAQLSATDQQTLVNLHNQYRANPSLAGAPQPQTPLAPLQWDSGIAAAAQAWANQCVLSYSQNWSYTFYGENLVYASPPSYFTVSLGFNYFVGGGQYFDFTTGACSGNNYCGNFVQIMAAQTTAFGCGLATCTFSGRQSAWFVCDYQAFAQYTGLIPYTPQSVSSPTVSPTASPTAVPSTISPTDAPTSAPSDSPTNSPTNPPFVPPTDAPTDFPTDSPTDPPTNSSDPTSSPTTPPSQPPTNAPTTSPTGAPTDAPTNAPTFPPSAPPTFRPTRTPPTASAAPTPVPTTPASSGDATYALIDYSGSSLVQAIKDQGQCGDCWSFSATALAEAAVAANANGQTIAPLSEQVTLDCSNSGSCDGGWPPTALQEMIARGGVDTMSSYPYTGAKGTCHNTPANYGGSIKHSYMVSDKTFSSIYQALKSYGPIGIAVYADDNVWYPYRSGVISYSATSSQVNHAVTIVGYDPTLNAWKIKNSWGSTWGISGYCYLDASTTGSAGLYIYGGWYATAY